MGDEHLFEGDAPTRSVGPTLGDVTGADPNAPPLLGTGDDFGPYRVIRLLGRGGMGEVYEVEDRENARRVALKVLSNRLSGPADRARFMREGRLAAGISHPNTVYVYGTDDINGVPVIAMELAPGGTLKDRVKIKGPLPPSQAIDALLQVIAGLEAAAEGGVLHRDIKPSNCFVDSDGTVKVGDFGLSISTQTIDERSLTMLGTVLGTPGFSSPEQLRGDELDVRSDIYSVGATLYYLLTGKAPFEDTNVIRLVTQVAQQMPISPRVARPEVPRDLANVVMRCLAKRPSDRYASYSALRAALEPFSSNAPAPAPLGVRFGAGVVDNVIMTIITVPAASYWWGGLSPTDPSGMVKGTVAGWGVLLLYYGLSEGAWGRSIGKWLFGLRVVDTLNHRPGIPRGLLRAATWIASDGVPLLAFTMWMMPIMHRYQNTPIAALLGLTMPAMSLVLLAVLFSTARRRNGYAAVHDLLTRTRVVLKRRSEDRLRSSAQAAPLPVSTRERIGPYTVLDERPLGIPDVVTAYDDRLRRRVWMHRRQPADAPLSNDRRALSRPARLRWLGGRRAEAEAWDAFEASEGLPLLKALETPRSWGEVRFWLLDLANEIRASQADGSRPVLSLDRVWITPAGRARLLDWGARETSALTPQAFLREIASRAARFPLPLHAHEFVSRLERNEVENLDTLVKELTTLVDEPAAIRRGRRVAHVLVIMVPMGFMGLIMLVTAVLLFWTQSAPGPLSDLTECLLRLEDLRTDPNERRQPGEEHALEIYVASHYQKEIGDERTWTQGFSMLRFNPQLRVYARAALGKHPTPTAQQAAAAASTVEPFLKNRRERARQRMAPRALIGILAVFAAGYSILMAGVGLLSALLFRGGLLLRLFGMAITTPAGEASRPRAFWRAVIAWSPAALSLVALLWLGLGPDARTTAVVIEGMSLALFVVGFAYAIQHPERGLQDRVAGTWLVPR
jgi:eukaryotic-like serine/threonine-protein kinase